jgi:hypothetical protein
VENPSASNGKKVARREMILGTDLPLSCVTFVVSLIDRDLPSRLNVNGPARPWKGSVPLGNHSGTNEHRSTGKALWVP